MHEGGGRWVGSNKLVELKKKKIQMFDTKKKKIHFAKAYDLDIQKY